MVGAWLHLTGLLLVFLDLVDVVAVLLLLGLELRSLEQEGEHDQEDGTGEVGIVGLGESLPGVASETIGSWESTSEESDTRDHKEGTDEGGQKDTDIVLAVAGNEHHDQATADLDGQQHVRVLDKESVSEEATDQETGNGAKGHDSELLQFDQKGSEEVTDKDPTDKGDPHDSVARWVVSFGEFVHAPEGEPHSINSGSSDSGQIHSNSKECSSEDEEEDAGNDEGNIEELGVLLVVVIVSAANLLSDRLQPLVQRFDIRDGMLRLWEWLVGHESHLLKREQLLDLVVLAAVLLLL